MFLLHKPTDNDVKQFIASQAEMPFSYAEAGATATQPPAGFKVDHNQTRLGEGEEIFARAVSALRGWKQFALGWVNIVPAGKPLEVGTTVAVQARTFGVWSLSAARIVYTIDDQHSDSRRFGFAYGTLPDHVECGEERFMIEWREDDSVWYSIYAFSHPQHPLVKLGSPLARMLQRRFVKASLAVMRAAVDQPV